MKAPMGAAVSRLRTWRITSKRRTFDSCVHTCFMHLVNVSEDLLGILINFFSHAQLLLMPEITLFQTMESSLSTGTVLSAHIRDCGSSATEKDVNKSKNN